MPEPWSRAARNLEPLQALLVEEAGPPAPLPEELLRLYGSPFGLPRDLVYANFVTSLDGVAVVGPSSGSQLSDDSQEDRLVMGLLRACASAILIGSGTLRGSPGHVWSAKHIYPPLAESFSELRRRLGLAERPTLVVATGSGDLDLDHPGLREPALLLTSVAGRERLQGGRHEVVALGDGPRLDPRQLLSTIRSRGHRTVLSEGGPQLLGQLLEQRLVDQLFLTLSPRLAGRTEQERRQGMVEGVDLLSREDSPRLLSARLAGSHLFLRYQVGPSA